MKSMELFPVLATGPFLGKNIKNNIKSDRTKLISEVRKINKKIHFIFPDDVIPERAEDTIFKNISSYLVDKTDQFEYIISKLVLHHFNLHLTGASIFELGQFHNFNIQRKTTVFSPTFKHLDIDTTRENVEDKYAVSEYIKGIYSITKYRADIEKSGHTYFPSAVTHQNEGRTLKTFYWQSYKIIKKIERMNINMIPRLYSKKWVMQSITFKDDKFFEVSVPIKHLLVLYLNFSIKNWDVFASRFHLADIKEMQDFHIRFRSYISDFFEKHPATSGKTVKWTLVFSKNRCQFKNIFYIFDWFIANQFPNLFDRKNKNQRSKMRETINSACNMYLYNPDDKYYDFVIKRKNKNDRIVTTYNKNYHADIHKAAIKEQSNTLHQQLDNQFINAYAYKTNFGNGLYKSIEEHSHNISGNFSFFKIDIKNFFDSINYDEIKHKVHLNCLSPEECKQGTILAPILSNIVFKDIDQKILESIPKGSRYTRYSDDILITIPNTMDNKQLTKWFSIIKTHIVGGGFEINEDKVVMGNQDNIFKYLGFLYNGDKKWSISNKKSKKIVSWIRNPRKYGLNKKYLLNIIDDLKTHKIMYRNDLIIDKFFNENNI